MPMLPCLRCRRFFKVKKTGVYFEEGMPLDPEETTWGPYKLWAGDLYECEGCGAQVIAGVGQGPIAKHYEPRYAEIAGRLRPLCRIDDCTGPLRVPRSA